jgi:hypothetical protein
MSDTKRRRGRPRGTGIDDSHRLREIDRALFAHPQKKLTTIIREVLGIANPSTIRRLRDKYNRARVKSTIGPIPLVRHHPDQIRTARAYAGRLHSVN